LDDGSADPGRWVKPFWLSGSHAVTMKQSMDDGPLAGRLDVPVAGGALHVAHAGPLDAERFALGVHGVTGSLMAWRTIARELDEEICLLAPDLRGRGQSRALPGPYGLAAHVADLTAVLDHVGVRSVVVMGHSMGAYLALRLAAEEPERTAGVVLLDAGLPFNVPDNTKQFDKAISQVAGRLLTTYPSTRKYLSAWRAHPAFTKAWDADPQAAEDFEAYACYDMIESGHVVRCTSMAAAVRTDSREMLTDDLTRNALDRVCAPVHLLRAERGVFDTDPLIPDDYLQAFAATYPSVRIEEVADVNHYTLILGPRQGPRRVAAALEALCLANGRNRNGAKTTNSEEEQQCPNSME
jgi:pimeloyl-ACP methyl ester carboxylesterase